MILDRFDHDELLAFVEGELGAEDAARLEHELANSPRAAMLIERMRRDRELLRSESEPVMPRNFLPAIESRLARPMLMETLREVEEAELSEAFANAPAAKPGAMRRQHRRAVLRRRLMKLSLAAAIVAAVGAGVWTLAVATNLHEQANDWIAAWRLPTQSPPPGDRTVAAPRSEAENDVAEGEYAWPPGAVVHHAPSPGIAAWEEPNGVEARDDDLMLGANDAPLLDVMLVIRASEPGAIESALAGLIPKLDGPAALVQNFSYDEAARLARAWSMQRGQQPEQRGQRRVPMAGTNGAAQPSQSRLARLADDAQRQLRQTRRAGGDDKIDRSGQLAGSPELAATFAEQLELSSRGATHTISVPAGKLHDLLAAINRAVDAEVMLTPLPQETGSEARSSDEVAPTVRGLWLAPRRDLQHLLARLGHLQDDAVIHLPVRVE